MEAPMADQRGVTIFFNDSTKLSLTFPKQAPNEIAAMLRLDDVLKKRYMLFEADIMMIPFENVRYVQLYPAPEALQGHTYIKGATFTGS